MGNIKYSDYRTSNGYIKTNTSVEFDKTYEYLRLKCQAGALKLYINNSSYYISVYAGETFELSDFSINTIKVEDDNTNSMGCQYFVAR